MSIKANRSVAVTKLRCGALLVVLTVAVLMGCSAGPGTDVPQVSSVTAVASMMPTAGVAETPTATTGAAAEGARAHGSLRVEQQDLTEGETVDVLLSLVSVEDLYGLEAHLAFDATRLAVIDSDDTEDGVQVLHGDLLSVDYVVRNQIDSDAGLIDYAVSQMPPSAGVGGQGEVVRIPFKAIAAGDAAVEVVDLVLANSQGGQIPVTLDTSAVILKIE